MNVPGNKKQLLSWTMRNYAFAATLAAIGLCVSARAAVPINSVRFPKIPAKVFGSGPFGLKAKAPNGAPVSYVSLAEDVAVVEGSSARIVGAGTAAIVASSTVASSGSTGPISAQRYLTVLPRRQKISLRLRSSLSVGERIEVEVTSNSPLSTTPIQMLSSNPEVLAVDLVNGRYWVTAKSQGNARITAFQEADRNHLAAKPSFKAVRIAGVSGSAGADSSSGELASPTTRELYDGLVLIDIPANFEMTLDEDGYKFGANDGKGRALVLSVSTYPDMTSITDFAANYELYYKLGGTPIVFREISGNVYTVETSAQLSIAKGAARHRFIFFNSYGGSQLEQQWVVYGYALEVAISSSTGMWSTPQGVALRKALDSIRLNPAAGSTPRN